MRYAAITAMALFVCTGLAQADVDITTGLVGYWDFEDVTGGIARDSSVYNNDGTINGATSVTGVPGFGNALDFNGTGDFVDVPSSSELNPTAAITVTAWVKARSFAAFAPPIVKKTGEGSTQWHGYTLETHSNPLGDGIPGVTFIADVVGPEGPNVWPGTQASSQSRALPMGEWVFLAGVFDGSSFNLYVGDLNDAPLGGVPNAFPYPIEPSMNNLNIGRDPSNTGRLFDGLIDEVRIYNRGLNETEVLAIYNVPEPATMSLLALGGLAVLKRRKA